MPARSAYGLHIRGLDEVAELSATTAYPPPGSRPVIVRQRHATPPPPLPLDADRLVRRLTDGRTLALDRHSGDATFYGPPLTADVLAHPYLAPVAVVVNRWAGRETFHAGAFVHAGRAWVVLGGRTAGKSTLLAALVARDVPVLADDIVVCDGGDVLAGPRCVDLREPVPGLGLPTRAVRDATRLRVTLPAVAPRLPLGGWIFLRWGDGPALTPVGAADLLARLVVRRSLPELPSDPAALLTLAGLPGYDLARPREWAAIDATHRLLDAVLTPAGALP
ncbi:hypothetical protein SAMN05443287_11481 [Micromonospora phaseoli]|uniref:HPr Serine kinase C-terminal domain-containing protein n=1 Tax=Micromonospora phaseoli TaxID=1144548 RepID=A0A1H7DJI2_9ACTN|nr:hypothetical protein [Micromonospora phaseoli]PZW02362.1 hypothetical protein CLV64_102737 [Micromonospora phaseoli]GIJ75636.1 hypothetical protein Xph01_00680 [Micromonospora phaseoli]SEK01514.1 hypothetical protein SAMN05443287_11481 [Micromonospora phaseoli]